MPETEIQEATGPNEQSYHHHISESEPVYERTCDDRKHAAHRQMNCEYGSDLLS